MCSVVLPMVFPSVPMTPPLTQTLTSETLPPRFSPPSLISYVCDHTDHPAEHPVASNSETYLELLLSSIFMSTSA